MGADDATDRVEFQKKVVVDGNVKRIDAYIPETKVLIEQKSLGITLDILVFNQDISISRLYGGIGFEYCIALLQYAFFTSALILLFSHTDLHRFSLLYQLPKNSPIWGFSQKRFHFWGNPQKHNFIRIVLCVFLSETPDKTGFKESFPEKSSENSFPKTWISKYDMS